MSKWDQYEEKSEGKWDKYAEAAKEAPGWFQPGSKSDAVVRGAADAATLGFGDEIQSYLRAVPSIGSSEGYLATAERLKNEERQANTNALETNPGSYIAGSIGASLPQGAKLAGAALRAPTVMGKALALGSRGAAIGAIQGAGGAETMSDIPADAAIGGAIGGAVNAAVPVGARMLGKGAVGVIPARSEIEAARAAEVIKREAAESGRNAALKTAVSREAHGPILEAKIAAREAAKAKAASTAAAAQLIAPTGGGVLGGIMGLTNAEEGTDPLDTVTNYAAAAGKGAAGGAAVGYAGKYGGRVISGMGKGLGNLSSGAYGVNKAIAQSVPGQVAGTLVVQPFSAVFDYLNTAKGAANPEVEQAAQDAQAQNGENATDEQKRKTAMIMNSDKTGRAVTNSASPVRGNR